MVRFHRNEYSTDNSFLFTSTLADAMRSMDVSRSPDSLISLSPLPVSRATGSCTRTFPSHFTCLSYLYKYGLSTRLPLLVCFTILLLSHQLIYAYCYCLCFPLCSLLIHLSTRYFWTYDLFIYLRLVCLLCTFVLVSRRPLYIWLGMRTCSPSSIYFATTLKV